MESAEQELKRRRERGRLAQSAFRQRQTQTLRDIKNENKALKSAIAEILARVDAATDPGLQLKVITAASIAGIGTNPAEAHNASPGALQVSALPRQDSMQVIPRNAPQTPAHATSSTWFPPYFPSFASPLHDTWALWRSSQPPGSGPTTYLLVHPDPFQCFNSTNGLQLIMQYMGSSAFTFSGCIFWHLIGKQEALLRAQSTLIAYRQRSLQRDHSSSSPPQGNLKEPTMMLAGLIPESRNRHSLPADWISLVEGRLNYYRQKGQEFATMQATGPYAAGPVHLDVRAPSGQLTPRWLTPLAIEQRIRAFVGDVLFAALVEPVVNRFEMDHGYYTKEVERPEDLTVIDKLLDLLADSYVCCPGSGPIWDSNVFDGLFASWFASVTGDSLGLSVH